MLPVTAPAVMLEGLTHDDLRRASSEHAPVEVKHGTDRYLCRVRILNREHHWHSKPGQWPYSYVVALWNQEQPSVCGIAVLAYKTKHSQSGFFQYQPVMWQVLADMLMMSGLDGDQLALKWTHKE